MNTYIFSIGRLKRMQKRNYFTESLCLHKVFFLARVAKPPPRIHNMLRQDTVVLPKSECGGSEKKVL